MGVVVDREAPFCFTKAAEDCVRSGALVPYPPATSDYPLPDGVRRSDRQGRVPLHKGQARAQILGKSSRSIQRFADPRDIGVTAVFLESHAGRSTSGQTQLIDGDAAKRADACRRQHAVQAEASRADPLDYRALSSQLTSRQPSIIGFCVIGLVPMWLASKRRSAHFHQLADPEAALRDVVGNQRQADAPLVHQLINWPARTTVAHEAPIITAAPSGMRSTALASATFFFTLSV